MRLTLHPFRIWECYFFKEFFKTVLFILGAVFFLFAVIDFSSQTNMHHQHGIKFQFSEIFWYYFYEFSLELKVLLPFSALIATIKVVVDLSSHGELTALLTSGIKLKRLLRPFLLIGLGLTFLSLANEQFVTPSAARYINRTIELKKREGKKRKKQTHIQSIALEGVDERLLYAQYESEAKRFYDVVWIKSFDELYRMKYLYPFEAPPLAKELEIIKRNERGGFEIVKVYESLLIPLHLPKEMLNQTILKPDELSLVELIKKSLFFLSCSNQKECQILTAFLLKFILPWFSLLAVLGPLPSSIFFSRDRQHYRIYLTSIFFFFFAYLFIEASSVLAKKQVLQPELALGAPFGVFLLAILFRYSRLR